MAVLRSATQVHVPALTFEVAGGVTGFVTMRELITLAKKTPTFVPLLRWDMASNDTVAAAYGSFLLGAIRLDYQVFKISLHQARGVDSQFFMLLQGAFSVLESIRQPKSIQG